MIKFMTGNILNADTEAIINTVNTVGVMGKGIALQFKNAYPENFKLYKKAADKKEIQIGKMFVTETDKLFPKYIINFPTKKHWRYPSKMEYIKAGIGDLLKVIKEKKIKSIAIPPLGSGNGGLNWIEVKELILNSFNMSSTHVILYQPSDIAYRQKYKKQLPIKELKLTAVRAMVLKLFAEYGILGEDLTLLEAQKLVYFLQRVGENLRLNFSENYYGPYAEKLLHVLYDMDGYYIEGTKYKDIKPFETINLISEKISDIDKYLEDNLSIEQKERLNTTLKLIYGYESPLGMELLSTLDFVIQKNIKEKDNIDRLIELVHCWSHRKKELMKESYLTKAYARLMENKDLLYSTN